MDDIAANGFFPDKVSWRKLDGSYITGLDATHMPMEKRIVCLPLNELIPIAVEHLEKQSTAEILWSHKVTATGQDKDKAWVQADTPEGPKRYEAAYVVGCDGATSTIRRQLFGDSFPGKTWDQQIVATNVYYPDMEKAGWEDSNFIIHPESYFMAAKIKKDGMYRITYGEVGGLTREEYRERQPAQFQHFLPGHPTPDKYELVNFSPYKIHQRLAEKMRVGRFILAADAGHLCNPL